MGFLSILTVGGCGVCNQALGGTSPFIAYIYVCLSPLEKVFATGFLRSSLGSNLKPKVNAFPGLASHSQVSFFLVSFSVALILTCDVFLARVVAVEAYLGK